MSLATVLPKLGMVIAGAAGISHVYVLGNTDETAIPDAVNDFPAVLLWPGESIQIVQMNGIQQHRWTAVAQILVSSGDTPSRGAIALPLLDALLAQANLNVILGGVATVVTVESWKFGRLAYGGGDYLGFDVQIEVIEELEVTFEGGS